MEILLPGEISTPGATYPGGPPFAKDSLRRNRWQLLRQEVMLEAKSFDMFHEEGANTRDLI